MELRKRKAKDKMIESIFKNKKQVVCDNCGEGFECDSWEEAQEEMKSQGWKTKKLNGEWVNYCKECVEEK